MMNYIWLRAYLLAFFTMLGFSCFGQKGISKLLFNSTDNVIGLDFSSETQPALFETGKKSNSTIGEGIAHAENEEGEIIFWVNSNGVYDKDHRIMPGSKGIFAHPSSTEIVVSPFPGDPDKYYIFYNNQLCSQLYYSVIDMNLRNEKGDVSHLNVPIEAGRNFAEGLEVVRIPCTKDYWLLAFECKKGMARFRVTEKGISDYSIIHEYVHDKEYTGRGELDYHNGRLGHALTFSDVVVFYSFDTETGYIPIDFTYTWGQETLINVYGFELSPDGSKLYATSLNNRDPFGNVNGDNLFCLDLKTHNLKQWTVSNTNPNCSAQMEGLGQIELGKDGNLYATQINGCQIVVIENPNSDDPVIRKINVPSVLSAGISDHVQSDFLDEELYLDASIKTEGDTALCPDEQVTLYLENYKSTHSVQWYKNGVLIPGGNGNFFVVSEPGRYNLQLFNPMGCSDFSNSIQIEDASVPEIALEEKYESCEGVSLEVSTGMEEKDGFVYSWSNGAQGTVASFTESGRYELIVSNGNCFNATSFEVLIHPKRSIKVPNVFTPNGDPLNESFEIRNLAFPVKLFIYNRWGALVYFSEDYKNDWKGENLEKGTYFYKIEPLQGCEEKKTGWVQIM